MRIPRWLDLTCDRIAAAARSRTLGVAMVAAVTVGLVVEAVVLHGALRDALLLVLVGLVFVLVGMLFGLTVSALADLNRRIKLLEAELAALKQSTPPVSADDPTEVLPKIDGEAP